MVSPSSRKVPREFALHWGKGVVAEEAAAEGPYHQPAIQLLEFEDGSRSLRFCYYSLDGRFQRSPLILSDDVIDLLRDQVRANQGIQALLRKLVD